MKISNPELKVVRFGADDVIATSGLLGALSGKSGLFYIPAGQYSGAYSGSGDYVQFNGTFGNYDGSNYAINGIYNVEGGVDEDRDVLIGPPPFFFNDTGVTVAGEVMANIARQSYDAVSYGDGTYYSNGTSYYDIYWQ